MYFSHAALSEFGCLFFFPLKASFKKKEEEKKGKKGWSQQFSTTGGKAACVTTQPTQSWSFTVFKKEK